MLGHRLLTRLLAPLRACAGDRAVGRMLADFALAEEGSARTMRWAAAAAIDPAERLAYLRHAEDEARHAIAFARRAAELGVSVQLAMTDAEDLYADLGPTRFLAFVALAEARGLAEFGAYERAMRRAGDLRTADLFAALKKDEEEHVRYSRARLVSACGGEERMVSRYLWAAAFLEARGALGRSGSRLGELVYACSMALLYALIVPFFAVFHRLARGREADGFRKPA